MSEAGEFQIIEQFFTYPSFGAWKSQGVGDDCAIIDTGISFPMPIRKMWAIRRSL